MSATLPCIINLVNTAFGVTVLAVPYCFHQCGIILGILLLLLSSHLTKISCSLLIRSAQISRRRDFESLGLFVDGFLGKFIVEMSLIGYLVGTSIAWFVVIGDVAPAVLSSLLGIEKSSGLRVFLIIVIGLIMVLPLSSVKDITALNSASKVAIAIYTVFVLQLFFSTLPQILSGEWVDVINFWKPEGILQCLPIFGMSFLIQTVLFVIYEALPEPSVKKMGHVVSTAMDVVFLLSVTVGFCGYVKYSSDGIQGDLLNNYKHDFVSEFIRLGFCISTILSFPLLIFPCRSSINSMISTSKMTSVEGSPTGGTFIPHERFMAITFGLIFGTLIFGILFPNVEFVMALVGATMGAVLMYILPSYIFLRIAGKDAPKTEAKVLLVVGITLFCLSTFSVLSMSESHNEVVQLAQLHPVQDTRNLENSNTNISTPKITQDIIKIEVKSVLNKSLDTKKIDGNPGLKSQIEKQDAEKTDQDSRKEPILPQGRVLMGRVDPNTIVAPPGVNETVGVVNDEVRLKDGEEREVDDRVRTATRKVLGSFDKDLYIMGGLSNENIGNITVLRKSNITNLNLASISEKKQRIEDGFEGKENGEGAENKTIVGVPNREKEMQDGVVAVVAAGVDVHAAGNSEENSRKNETKSKKYQDVKSKKLLKDYLDSALKSNAQTISNTSSVHREI